MRAAGSGTVVSLSSLRVRFIFRFSMWLALLSLWDTTQNSHTRCVLRFGARHRNLNDARVRRVYRIALITTVVLGNVGCGIIKEKPPAKIDEMSLVGKEIPPEKAEEILGEVGDSFVYGPSLGETVTNVGVAIAFPPYALYLLGNAILSLSGYEPVTISSMLPEEEGKNWSNTVDTVMSGPGRMVAAMAGHEARSREVNEEKMRQLLAALPEKLAQAPLPVGEVPGTGAELIN